MTKQWLRVSEMHWRAIRDHAARSFRGRNRAETAAICLLGRCVCQGRTIWLVHDVLLPGPDDLTLSRLGQVFLSAGFLRRVHLAMRRLGLAGLGIIHTHPLSDELVQFSDYDNQEEPLLIRNLCDIDPGTNVVSIVLGKRSQCARVWQSGDGFVPLDEIAAVGETLNFFDPSGTAAKPDPIPAAVFDRGLALTGTGALAVLSKLRIAIIGASGTGSVMCEFLKRAGARNIISIDDDFMKLPNINRVMASTMDDVRLRVPKVRVAERAVRSSGMDCNVEAVHGTILDKEVLAKLRSADVILGCVDAAMPRLLLSKVTYQYLIPFIDVGSEIGCDGKGIISADARATYVAPGRRCLCCTGLVTARQLHFEGISFQERERVRRLGYSEDIAMEQPAVMELNAQAALLGSMVLRHLLQPFMATPLPSSILVNLVTLNMRGVEASRPEANCSVCQRNPAYGFGDFGPELGFEKEVVDSLTGRGAE